MKVHNRLARFSVNALTMFVMAGLVISCTAPDQQAEAASDDTPREEVAFSYDGYAETLEKYVNARGFVDYKGLKADRKELDRFITSLKTLPRATYEAWDRDTKVAFWSNVYNAFTLQVILNHYPIEKGGFISGLRFPENSIRQIDGVWDAITRPIMGQDLTLGEIEHEILRKEFDEPRIHMAINCASVGCPPLREEPFRGEKLDAQFDDQSKRFLSNPEKFRIDRDKDRVYLSPIFDWFGGDFVNKYGVEEGYSGHSRNERAVLNFISNYVSDADAAYLRKERYSLRNLDYDWSLNEQ